MDLLSTADLLRHAAEKYFTEPRGHWVFRGHSDIAYKLVPSVGRISRPALSARLKLERTLFDVFQREACGMLAPQLTNDWEWLSIAQHHGLPTRLLDWTHNPLVALYFAVQANPNKDGQLLAIRGLIKLPQALPSGSPFDIETPVKYYPHVVSPRMRCQEGLFVVCAQPETPLDETLPEGWRIDDFRIPAERKPFVRYELFRMGIHASALFPDLDGLASRIKWQHEIDSPFKLQSHACVPDAFAAP
jgi:hypothetical protein